MAVGILILGDQHSKPIHNANAPLTQLIEAWQSFSVAFICHENGAVIILVHFQCRKQSFESDNFSLLGAILWAIAYQSAYFGQSLIDLFLFFRHISELFQAKFSQDFRIKVTVLYHFDFNARIRS